jgi:hypothetical protein
MTALNASIIDSVFARLAAVYGSKFTAQWPASQAASVKAEWAHELREFAGKPDAIAYALDCLPAGSVPNVLEIRDIARRRPGGNNATGTRRETPVTPEERERALVILRAFERPTRQDAKQWARRLRYRELCGERLSKYQRDAWRVALRYEQESTTDTYADTKPVIDQQVSEGM